MASAQPFGSSEDMGRCSCGLRDKESVGQGVQGKEPESHRPVASGSGQRGKTGISSRHPRHLGHPVVSRN